MSACDHRVPGIYFPEEAQTGWGRKQRGTFDKNMPPVGWGGKGGGASLWPRVCVAILPGSREISRPAINRTEKETKSDRGEYQWIKGCRHGFVSVAHGNHPNALEYPRTCFSR